MWLATSSTSRSFATCLIGLSPVGLHYVTTKDDRIFPQSTPPAGTPWLAPSRQPSRNSEQSPFKIWTGTSTPTTRATRESRWGLWLRLAQQWQLPPLSLTVKAGRYRSAPQVFSMARQQHVLVHKVSAPVDVEQHIKKTIRSIERGIGPPELKDAFIVNRLRLTGRQTCTTACWQR